MGDHHIIPEPPAWPRADAGILQEVPTTLGLVLWQAVRHARDWLAAAPGARAALFHPGAPAWVAAKRAEARALAPELPGLDRIVGLTRAPLGVGPGVLAEACREVALWGEQRGHREVAIHYAEAAALAAPADPRLANLAGRLTRNAGEYARAELWLERGIGLARRRRDRVEYTRGHLGMGLLWKALEMDRAARRHFHTAAVAAMKSGREWLAAEAQHDLFALLIDRRHYEAAAAHASQALAWYPKHHPRLPFFAADVAYLLIQQHHHEPAIGLLEVFADKVDIPPDRVLGVSLWARALASMGRVEDFRRVRSELEILLSEHHECEAAARINLAEGERALRRWAAAEFEVRTAIDVARHDGSKELLRLGEKVLGLTERRLAPPGSRHVDSPDLTELVSALGRRLATWTTTRRGRSRTLSNADWAA